LATVLPLLGKDQAIKINTLRLTPPLVSQGSGTRKLKSRNADKPPGTGAVLTS
jgi:hypothetical protein